MASKLSKSARATAIALALSALAPAAAFALDAPAAKLAIDHELDADYPQLDHLYKDIHQHPELGFQEVRTAALLAKEMRALGFTVTEGIGKTGIVAIYKNGPGPIVMVRTELDALPLEEKTGLPYASTAKQMANGRETFVDHACGHDIHMAVWRGTAKALVEMKSQWSGTLMFIGQPAEELASGARTMIADHLFERFPKPNYGFALHVEPKAYNHIAYKMGVVTSNSDDLDVVFHGRGGHGSMPNLTIDPVMEAARFIVDVQGVISREKDPMAFGVVTVGSVQAGNAGNVIPDTAHLRGTIRSFDAGVRAKMFEGIERTAKAEAMLAGAPPPDYATSVGGRAVINDDALTERTGKMFASAFGDKVSVLPQPGAPSEDYSEFINAGVPSTFFALGGLDPAALEKARVTGVPVAANHSPYFAPIPEPTIRTGVEAMTLAVMNVLQK